MSIPSPNAEHSPPQSLPPSPGLPDLTELAELAALTEHLQEAVNALTAFRRRFQRAEDSGLSPAPGNQDAAEASAAPAHGSVTPEAAIPAPSAPESAAPQSSPRETRCYELPGNILEEEREMLEFHGAANWQELLNKAHDRIYATVLLMERVPAEEEIDGFSITLIAENLMAPLRMLGRLCSLTADFQLVSVTKAANS